MSELLKSGSKKKLVHEAVACHLADQKNETNDVFVWSTSIKKHTLVKFRKLTEKNQ